MDVDRKIEETKRFLAATYQELSEMLADPALSPGRRALILSRLETLRERRQRAVDGMRRVASEGKEPKNGGRTERNGDTRHGQPVA